MTMAALATTPPASAAAGADPTSPETRDDVRLLRAAAKGRESSVRRLLANGNCSLDSSDYDKRTPLHLAASAGHVAVVNALLAAGADVQARDRWGRTPRDSARESGAQDCVTVLEGAAASASAPAGSGGGDGDVEQQSNTGHNATAGGDRSSKLLASKMSLVGFVLLHACAEGDLSEVRNLVRNADVNEADYDNRTALHLAACEGFLPIVRVLVSHGADLFARDRWGNTALNDAKANNWKDVSNFLEHEMDKAQSASGNNNNGDKNKATKMKKKKKKKSKEKTSDKIKDTDHNNDKTSLMKEAAKAKSSSSSHDAMEHKDGVVEEERHCTADEETDMETETETEDNDGNSDGDGDGFTQVWKQAQGEIEALQARGVAERWALDIKEVHMDPEPFARGSGGALFFTKWRRMRCVAKRLERVDMSAPEAVVAFADQLNELSHVRHPYLIMFLGACFQVGEPPLLLIEFCAGGTLLQRLMAPSKPQRLPRVLRFRIVHELALGMNCLHNCDPPVLHRDLKPSNVLLTDDEHVKVTDFGLRQFMPGTEAGAAKARSQAAHASHGHPRKSNKSTAAKDCSQGASNTAAKVVERFRFVAPEVLAGGPHTTKSDVYSYALLVYWLLANHPPFQEHASGFDASQAAARGERPKLAEVPLRFRALLSSCWDHDPSKRPTFDAIIKSLDEHVAEAARRGSCTVQ